MENVENGFHGERQSNYRQTKTFNLEEWQTELLLKLVKIMEMRGIEPRAFRMQSEHSTTELHPLR